MPAFAADPERMLDDCHSRERRFRRRDGVDLTYFRRADGWWRVEPDARDAKPGEANQFVSIDWNPPKSWGLNSLLPPGAFDADIAAEELADRLEASGERLSDRQREELTALGVAYRGKQSEFILYYHDALGGDYRPLAPA